MCIWLSGRMERSSNWINLIWFSDESHFHLNGAINNHNTIFWGAEPPEEITERYLKEPKVTCFCTFNARWGTLGPYWFENDNSRTVTINSEHYRAMLQKFHNDLAQKVTPNQLSMAWFMHPRIQLVTPSLSCSSSSETALLSWVLLMTVPP